MANGCETEPNMSHFWRNRSKASAEGGPAIFALAREECMAGNVEAASRAMENIGNAGLKRVARAYKSVASSKETGQSLGPLLKTGTLNDPEPAMVESYVPLDLVRIQIARGDLTGAKLSADWLHSVRAYAEIAAAEFRQGKIKAARETLERALISAEANPDSYDAAGTFYTIAFYLHKAGYVPGLREVAARARGSLEPKDAAIVCKDIAVMQRQAGDSEGATQTLALMKQYSPAAEVADWLRRARSLGDAPWTTSLPDYLKSFAAKKPHEAFAGLVTTAKNLIESQAKFKAAEAEWRQKSK